MFVCFVAYFSLVTEINSEHELTSRGEHAHIYLLSTERVLCGSAAFYFDKVMSGTE